MTSIFTGGGHDEPLHPAAGLRIPGTVTVRQLDTASDAVLDHVLRAIAVERAAGTITTGVPYKGKHARRWFDMVYPPRLAPVILGAFPAGERQDLGTMLGWISMILTAPPGGGPATVALGCIVHPSWRDRGLGTSLLGHAMRHGAAVYPGRGTPCYAFETMETNDRVRRIARKVAMVRAGERLDEQGIRKVLFMTSSTAAHGHRLPAGPQPATAGRPVI